MYRKPGSPGVLKGVLSGPYAGGARRVDAAKLPRAARQRLADVLAGRAEPTPILSDTPGLGSRFGAICVALVAFAGLAGLMSIGFGDPVMRWAYQPTAAIAGYVAATMLLVPALLVLYRRRAHARGGALAPGRYLLALDVVDVLPPDATGAQILVVTPLGDGRDVRIRAKGRRDELVVTLERGAELVFALRSERDGEHALRHLEHAQSLLEELTYKRDLEKALAKDVFFDVRADDSWSSVAPSRPVSESTSGRRRLLHGPASFARVLAASAALGWATFHARNWASDRALYLRAMRIGTPESLDAYLVRGRSYRTEAEAFRDAWLEVRRADEARRRAESKKSPGFEGPPRAEWELTPEEAAARGGSVEKCVAGLRAHASTTQPKAFAILEALVRDAGRSGDNAIPVRFTTAKGTRPAAVPELDVEVRATTTIWALERIFSESCPARLAKLTRRPVDRATIGAPGLDVEVDLAWPQVATWKVPSVHAPTLVFDVTLRGESSDNAVSFRLTMPPPAMPPSGVRPRSLFIVPTSDDTAGDVYRFLSARAFDRLYDELYGLFFSGDPRVPLHEPAGPADEGR